MVRLALKRLVHNRSLSAALLLAAVLCVAAVASVPIYTRGVLQKLLRADLERLQHTGATFPGRIHAELDFSHPAHGGEGFARYEAVDAAIERLAGDLGLPVLTRTRQLTLGPVFFRPRGPPDTRRLIKVEALSGLAGHVRITRGRLFGGAGSTAAPGVPYEAIVTEHAVAQLDLRLGATYELDRPSPDGTGPLAVTVVGVFTVADERDPFWFLPPRFYDDSFLVDDGRFRRELLHAGSEGLKMAQWHYAMDYHRLTVGDLPRVERVVDAYGRRAADVGLRWRVAFRDTLAAYRERAHRLRLTLWFLQVPVLVVVLLFTHAIARARVESERVELATLFSRGARARQLAQRTLVEGGLLAVAALLIGLPAGLLLSRLVGVSAGFLTFVQRQALPVTLDAGSCGAGTAGALLFLLVLFGSTLRHTRRTIVHVAIGHRERAAAAGTTDRRRTGRAAAAGVALFPYLVGLVFMSARRTWSPALYGALARLSRGGGERVSVMLFLTLAFAFGAFFSVTARTVAAAAEDRIRYREGADLVIEPLWRRQPAAAAGGPAGYRYVEPDLQRYAGIDGIEGVTGVLRRSGVTAVIGGGRGTVVELMGVVPDGFAEVAWFRAGLLPVHRNHYFNLLAADPRAMLLSTTLQRAHGIELGAPVSLTWAGQAPLAGHVAAFVDFWPAYDPHRDHLVVANLAYVHATMQLEPYELWAERATGVDNRTILDGIDRAGVRISGLTDGGSRAGPAAGACRMPVPARGGAAGAAAGAPGRGHLPDGSGAAHDHRADRGGDRAHHLPHAERGGLRAWRRQAAPHRRGVRRAGARRRSAGRAAQRRPAGQTPGTGDRAAQGRAPSQRARARGADRFETELAALDVELAALHLEVARRDLLGTELRAPMDGIVTYTLPAAPGDHVDAFVTVARVADPAELVVEYRGAEADRFELGVQVDLTVGAGQAQHRGRVIETPSSLPPARLTQEPAARDRIRIRMLEPRPALYIGQSVRVVLTEERREAVVVIPRNLVRSYLDADYVYVLDGGEKQERAVEVGLVTASQAEIVRGLDAGEQVIVR